MRAGYPVFLISPFASPASLKHLINTSGVHLILTNPDDQELYSRLSSAVADIRRTNPDIQPTISSQLQWSQIFSSENLPEDGPAIPTYDSESTCIILHSSGRLPHIRTGIMSTDGQSLRLHHTSSFECMVPQNGRDRALAALYDRHFFPSGCFADGTQGTASATSVGKSCLLRRSLWRVPPVRCWRSFL